MSEITQEEALRVADVLAGQALKETEARCSVLAQFIGDCDRAGSRTSARGREPGEGAAVTAGGPDRTPDSATGSGSSATAAVMSQLVAGHG